MKGEGCRLKGAGKRGGNREKGGIGTVNDR